MKKHFFTLLIVSIFTGVSAQNYTQVFDSVFQHVDLSNTSTGILYERVMPFSNLVSYVTDIPHPVDTCDYWQFIFAYDELYRAGARNTFLSDSVEGMIRHLPTDNTTVVLGILHANFNTFDTIAMQQRLYYDSDSVLWENTSVNVSLFDENNAYMVAPLVDQTPSLTIRFVIDGHFFFDNTTNPLTSLRIDFGDGNGERPATINSSINVIYPSEGKKILRIRSTFYDGTTVISYAKLVIDRNLRNGNGTSSHPYTENMTLTGVIQPYNPYIDSIFDKSQGYVRIYYANSDMILRKPVLIVDGFDPMNNRRFDTCYEKNGQSLWSKLGDGLNEDDNMGEMLLALGYDVVLLDFPDGGTYIEQNAMVCIAVINKINERLQLSGSKEQIVVVGPSMGGQITRYALAYMEQNPEANTNYGNHNCRLWVSFDSPHQGANISIGVQKMVENYRGILKNLWNNTLCCNAAKQMLIYHKQNGANTYFNTYYQQLALIKYPNSTRNIAVSNGSLNNVSNGIASSESLALRASFPYFIGVFTRNMAHQGSCNVYEIIRHILFVPIRSPWEFINDDNRGSIDVAPGCKYFTFDILTDKLLAFRILGIAFVDFNQHSHCFMPTTSVLDINEPIPYATDLSNIDLVAEGKIPFDSYWGPLNKNMEHITFDYNLVNYLLNEIETYIQGPRDIFLCTRPSYTLHLPQDSTAVVTWLGSENIRIVPTSNPNIVEIIPLASGDAWISAVVSTLRYNDTLAPYPIHIYNNVNFTPVVSGTTIPGLSMVIDNEKYLTADTFCVENGKTLTIKGTLHCAPGTRLIVRPGGKLIVDGGTLTSACPNEMWQGVEVVGDRTKHQLPQYQGIVELRNGATIENAHCGIHTGLHGDAAYATAGGIITAENAHFINNRRSVAFISYTDTLAGGALGDNVSYFHNTDFTVNNNNLFAANNCDFIDHVTLWEVKGIEFKGCTFENLTSAVSGRRHAIYAEDAGFTVATYCEYHPSTQPGCECPENDATPCSFSGFTTAVELNTTGDPFPVTVDEAHFSNGVEGLRINGNTFVTVTRCTFNLQSTPEIVNTNTGLILNHCNGYKVEGNAFNRSHINWIPKPTGISVINSGPQSNNIYRNTFNKMRYGIHVSDTNGGLLSGLSFSCNEFNNCEFGIYATANASLAPSQGSLSQGVDNRFSGTQASSFYNLGPTQLVYYHSNGNNNLYLTNPTGVFAESDLATGNNCLSTLCGVIPDPGPMTSFAAQVSAYTSALAYYNDNTDNLDNNNSPNPPNSPTTLAEMHQTLSDSYYGAVRSIMSDSLLDLSALEQWHAAAQPIADPYSLTETRFMEGYAETFAANADSAEMANYAEFHAMKVALRNNGAGNDGSVETQNFASLQPGGHVNWYTLTPAQIAQLQTIAERNTGRASVMAKGVLCFFFGICYEDEDYADPSAETRVKSTATGDEGVFDTPLRVWPNPTDDLLFVELCGAEIASVALYDLQGRVVETRHGTSLQGGTATVNMRNVPAGVYVLRVTDAEGREHQGKIVRR